MSTARGFGIALTTVLALLTAAAAAWLWPLVRRTDAAYLEHLQRDVEYGWLLLQVATPLFAVSAMTSLGTAALAWRLVRLRAAIPPTHQG
jgi:hypothetical protein